MSSSQSLKQSSKTYRMPNRRRLRIPFAVKLILYSLSLIVITVGSVAITTYSQAEHRIVSDLKNQILTLAQTSAPLIDGDLHEEIFYTSESGLVGEQTLDKLRRQLVMIRDYNNLPNAAGLSPIYTLRPTWNFKQSATLEFVVMTNPNANGDFYSGSQISALEHHRKALNGEFVVTDIYRDEEGSWITAVGPIWDSNRHVVGILQTDRRVDFIEQELAPFKNAYGRAAGYSFLFGLILACGYAYVVMRPLRRLNQAAQAFGKGKYDIRIEHRSNDEIGDLTDAFNGMAANLQEFDQKAKNRILVLEKGARELYVDAQQMGIIANSLQDIIYSQKTATEGISRNVEDTIAIIGDTLAFAEQTSLKSDEVASQLDNSALMVTDANSQISEVSSSLDSIKTVVEKLVSNGKNIHEISNVIGKISSETTLLSLNASIEAARAGEYGRGFAVVATEVGNLSKQTTQRAAEINQALKEVQSNILDTDRKASGSLELAALASKRAAVINDMVGKLSVTMRNIRDGNQTLKSKCEQSSQSSLSIRNSAQLIQAELLKAEQLSGSLTAASLDLVKFAKSLEVLSENDQTDVNKHEVTLCD